MGVASSVLLADLVKSGFPTVIVRGELRTRTTPGKDGKPGFTFRQQDAILCVQDGPDELKAKFTVDVPEKADPYLPGRYVIGGATAFEVGDFAALSLNRRGIQLIPVQDDEIAHGKGKF
jgi:hypothetical protein